MYVKQNNNLESANLNKIIGNFIRELRVSNSLSGKELGQLIHVSQQQVSRYENGVTEITFITLNTILIALDTDWSEFYRKVFNIDIKDHVIKNINQPSPYL